VQSQTFLKRRARFAATGLLLATLSASGCGVAASGMNMQGARLYQQGDYRGAAQQFTQAIAQDPSNADAYYNLAATYHRLGKLNGQESDLTQAESFYNQCLDRDPNHADCYRGLAVLLAETGRSDAAFRLLEGWVARAPALADAKIELARLNEEFGERGRAEEYLLGALKLEPNNPRALAALGSIREREGQYLQALENYERSLRANQFQPMIATRVAALRATVGPVARLSTPAPTRVVDQPTQWKRY
jgi:tetratricopeptide (TPR) repeat protein